MAVRTAALGGVDWSDGEVLYDHDLNDTFGAVTVHRKVYTNAGPLTHTGDTNYVNVASFTFAKANCLILGVQVRCNVSESGLGTDTGYVQIRIVGATLGTKYLSYSDSSLNNTDSNVTVGATQGCLFGMAGNSSINAGASASPGLKTLDATNTFYLDLKTSNAAQTVTLTSFEVIITYAEGFHDD